MSEFLEEYFIAICSLILGAILICLIPNHISAQFNQTQTVLLEQEKNEDKNISADNNVQTEHHTHILNSVKHMIKNIGMIICICILLISNVSLIIKDIMMYNTLLQNNRTYYLKKTTMECNPMNVDYDKNCSIVLY